MYSDWHTTEFLLGYEKKVTMSHLYGIFSFLYLVKGKDMPVLFECSKVVFDSPVMKSDYDNILETKYPASDWWIMHA